MNTDHFIALYDMENYIWTMTMASWTPLIIHDSYDQWSLIIASEDSYDSHDQSSHMIAMNTDCEQSRFIGTAMNLDSERSMIKHIIHDEVGSMLWNAGVHTWSTLILYHIMTPIMLPWWEIGYQASLPQPQMGGCKPSNIVPGSHVPSLYYSSKDFAILHSTFLSANNVSSWNIHHQCMIMIFYI